MPQSHKERLPLTEEEIRLLEAVLRVARYDLLQEMVDWLYDRGWRYNADDGFLGERSAWPPPRDDGAPF